MNKIYVIFIVLITSTISCEQIKNNSKSETTIVNRDSLAGIWPTPDTLSIPNNEFGNAVKYGKQLLLNTAYYIGPDGIVSQNLGNKMNCSNCHLEAGTKPYGLNFFSTHARYPQYRARENKILSLAERVNNCVERPHNGKPLELDSKEMTAIISYIQWLGQNVPTGKHVKGDKLMELTFPNRAAEPIKGEKVYINECKSCHGDNGEGKLKFDSSSYEFPPLWGVKSYQTGSSMHRIIKSATFIYANMPNGIASYNKPKLTIEEAFDVAAFINDDRIHKRPTNNKFINYPNYKYKPIDYDKGPYIDTFTESQHKFGPYQPIIDFRRSKGLQITF